MFHIHGIQGRAFSGTLEQLRQLQLVTGVARTRRVAAVVLVPIFLGVAVSLGLPRPLFAAAIAVSASCAFLLPAAAPPDAAVYATEQVPQARMMRCSLVPDLVCIAVVAVMATRAFA